MKVFLDTNVVLSAALFPKGTAAAAYAAVLSLGHEMVVSDHVIAELLDVVDRKFRARKASMDAFVEDLPSFAIVTVTPDREEDDEAAVRDPKDRPILRAARAAKCDLILTGDKDLLMAGIEQPESLSPGAFLTRVAESIAE